MLMAAQAVLHQLDTLRIIAPVFHGGVVALFAFGTRKMDNYSDVFFLRHSFTSPDNREKEAGR